MERLPLSMRSVWHRDNAPAGRRSAAVLLHCHVQAGGRSGADPAESRRRGDGGEREIRHSLATGADSRERVGGARRPRRASRSCVQPGYECPPGRQLHRRGEDRVDQAHSLCDLWPRRTAVWRRAGQVSCCSGGVDGVVELVEGRTKPALDCLRGSPRSGNGGNGGPAQAREGSGTSGGNSETTPGRGIGLGQGLHQIVPVGLQPVLGQFPLHRNVTPIGLCAILLVSQAFSKSPVELVQLFDATLPIAPKRET